MIRQNGIYISSNEKLKLSYPDDDNNFCFDIEEKSFWFNHRNQVIKSAISRQPFVGNFADIGGGNGFQSLFLQEQFPDHKFYLIEPNYLGCQNAMNRGLDEIYCMPFSEFPFGTKNIGGIGLFDVIEHLPSDIDFLKQLQDASLLNTVLYITVPAFECLWSDVDEFSGHYRRYTRKSLINVLQNTGWKVKYTSYFFSYLPPLIWTLRCFPNMIFGNRKTEVIKKAEEKHHQGNLYERILKVLHNHEPTVILNRSISFGSSLLAIGVK